MGTPVLTNIIVGGATLYYAPVGEPLPDDTDIEFGEAWGGNWARVGFTKAPLSLTWEQEEMEVEVEELIVAVDRIATKQSVTLETVLAEFVAEYIALAFSSTVTNTAAGAGQVGKEEVAVGGYPFLDKYAWGFEARATNASNAEFPVRLFFYRATMIMNGNLEFSNRSGEYPGIPIQIKGLGDPSKTKGEQVFLYQRIKAAATS